MPSTCGTILLCRPVTSAWVIPVTRWQKISEELCLPNVACANVLEVPTCYAPWTHHESWATYELWELRVWKPEWRAAETFLCVVFFFKCSGLARFWGTVTEVETRWTWETIVFLSLSGWTRFHLRQHWTFATLHHYGLEQWSECPEQAES